VATGSAVGAGVVVTNTTGAEVGVAAAAAGAVVGAAGAVVGAAGAAVGDAGCEPEQPINSCVPATATVAVAKPRRNLRRDIKDGAFFESNCTSSKYRIVGCRAASY